MSKDSKLSDHDKDLKYTIDPKHLHVGHTIEFTFQEYWSPTFELRWLKKKVFVRENTYFTDPVLQQKWGSNMGNEKWEDIEIVTEEE